MHRSLLLLLLLAVTCGENRAPQQQMVASADSNPANWMTADTTTLVPLLAGSYCDEAQKPPAWGAFLSENQAERAAFCDSLAKAGNMDCSDHPRVSADHRLIYSPLASTAVFQNLDSPEALGSRLGGLAYVRRGKMFDECTGDCDSVFTVGLPDSSSLALVKVQGEKGVDYQLAWFDIRTPQLTLHRGIQVGMTRAEVRRRLKGILVPMCEYEGGILLKNIEVESTLELHFTDGRLSRVVFNPYLG